MRNIDYFDRSAERHPDRPVIVDGDTRWSYAEARGLSHQLARAMQAAGLEAQAPVAIFSPNHASVLLVLLGLWRAGAVWVPVNTRNALDANIAYLNYVRAGWLFYHSSFGAEAQAVKAEVPSIQHLVCLDGPDCGHLSLDAFMQGGEGGELADQGDPVGNPDDLVAIIATGGTTGAAKGVRVPNRSWGTLMETIGNLMPASDPVCLASAPLTHAAGPVAMAAIAMGATVVVLPRFDAELVMRAIGEHRVTHMFLPPTALYSMLAHPNASRFDYSSLKYFLLAGSPVSPDKFRQATEVFGPCLCQSYGQTEAHMIVTWLPPDVVTAAAGGEHPERLMSCGRPSYPVRVEIMNDEGGLLAPGEVGEIVVRGGLVGDGYFELPEATAEARAFGWHHTGDVGRKDADGFVYIVDRKKDMIVTGGFNVFSAEVEAAVMELDGVRECAVVGVPDDKWGEAVTAVAALNDGASITPAAIIAHCKARLGAVKAPKAVHLWPDVPRTAAGKFDKKAIRARFWQGAERNVH
ncbi:MAG TPA: AMP-binding protein [Caulobacteraceae bacterium]